MNKACRVLLVSRVQLASLSSFGAMLLKELSRLHFTLINFSGFGN